MANLQEKLFWEPGIYQLETSDPVLAGPDGIDNLQGKQLANRTVYLKDQVEQLASGKQPAGNAAKLSAARKIEATGDGSWNVMFDGSRDVSGQLTLRDSGVAPGSYGMVTVDGKGRVTAGRQMSGDDVPAHDWSKVASGKPTTLAGYGITDAASKDSQGRVWGTTIRAEKGVPAGDGSNVGFAFGPDGDTGLFADASGDKPITGTSVLGMYINSSKVLGVDKTGAVWTPAYGMLDDKFASKADAQPASSDLTALANLKGAAGLYVNTGPGAATVRSLAAGQGITISNGDGKAGNPTVALANSGAAAGTYGMVTVDTMGRVIGGRQMAAMDVPTLDWSKITTGKPTTLAGYGIVDGITVDRMSRKNLVRDSGRFIPVEAALDNPITAAFSNQSAMTALTTPDYQQTVTVANVGKFIHDNTSNGGTKGELEAPVRELLAAFPARKNFRYGSEFYIAEFNCGTLSYSPDVLDGIRRCAAASYGGLTEGNITFMLWLRCKKGSVRLDVTSYKNGKPASNPVVAPADGWVHCAGVTNWEGGYSISHIRAEDNSVFQVAMSVALSGNHLGYVHEAPISF